MTCRITRMDCSYPPPTDAASESKLGADRTYLEALLKQHVKQSAAPLRASLRHGSRKPTQAATLKHQPNQTIPKPTNHIPIPIQSQDGKMKEL